MLIKLVIVLLCLIFLSERFNNIEFNTFQNLFYKNILNHWVYFYSTLLLLFLNWGLETLKWKYLINPIENISFKKAFSAVLGGVAFSSFTPNRVGEFAGRMLFLKNKLDPRIIALTIIGSMSQFMITLIIGLPLFLFFILHNNFLGLEISSFYKVMIQITIFIIPISYLLVFWNLPLLFRKLKQKFGSNNSISNLSESIIHIGFKGLKYISFLSLLRYTIFTMQYVLILKFFDIKIDWLQLSLFIPVIFFIQSVIPSFTLTELGIRVTVAISVLKFLNIADTQIMAASSLLWVINLMIPAIVGATTLLFTKLNNS